MYFLRIIMVFLLVLFNVQNGFAEEAVVDVGVRPLLKRQSIFMKYVPAEKIEELSANNYSKVISEAEKTGALTPNSDPSVLRLQAIANRILPLVADWNARASEWKWQINLIKSDAVNAWCMPGGKIAFYTALLGDELKLSDDELAFVMSHEIAHALREHGRQQFAKVAVTSKSADVIKTWLSGKERSQSVVDLTSKLLELKFGREFEMEADMIGAELVARAGYNPNASVTFMQKLSSTTGGDSRVALLSDHPTHLKRIENLTNIQPRVLPFYQSAKN